MRRRVKVYERTPFQRVIRDANDRVETSVVDSAFFAVRFADFYAEMPTLLRMARREIDRRRAA